MINEQQRKSWQPMRKSWLPPPASLSAMRLNLEVNTRVCRTFRTRLDGVNIGADDEWNEDELAKQLGVIDVGADDAAMDGKVNCCLCILLLAKVQTFSRPEPDLEKELDDVLNDQS